MKKITLFITIILLAGLILIGSSCEGENKGKESLEEAEEQEEEDINLSDSTVVLDIELSNNKTKSVFYSNEKLTKKGSFRIKEVSVDTPEVKLGNRISGSFKVEYALPVAEKGSWRIEVSAINLTDEKGNNIALSTNMGSLGEMKGVDESGEGKGYFIIPTSELSLGTHTFYIEIKADQIIWDPAIGQGAVVCKFEDKESFANVKVIKAKGRL